MRLAMILLLAVGAPGAQTAETEKQAVIRAVERTFEAMAARDAAALEALLLPQAQLIAVLADGAMRTAGRDEFIARIAALDEAPLERMWNPVVMVRGRLAALWAEYDFHRGSRFSHCGVDSVQLVKTADGWKIAGISYTVEKEGCRPPPPRAAGRGAR